MSRYGSASYGSAGSQSGALTSQVGSLAATSTAALDLPSPLTASRAECCTHREPHATSNDILAIRRSNTQ